jgi:heme/copper-type cytochrome/quinol oxidase subunit 2
MFTMVTIIAGVLGFLVLCLVVAVVVVFKRRKNHPNGGTLLVQDES